METALNPPSSLIPRPPVPNDAHVDAVPKTSSDNKFHKAISAWRNIDLTKLVPSLDTTAQDLVTHQKDALVERKDLAEKTKVFRRLEDTTKITEIKSLLKAYQSYIDLVSNNSKTVQNAFLQVYSSLSEAPDPYPLLEASVDSLVVADETVPKLQGENTHLQSRVTKLTRQLEETEERLGTEIHARQELQARADSKIKDVELSWSAVLSEKQDNWSAKEKAFEERAENQERLLKELKASFEVSQRLDRNQDGDGATQAGPASAELEIVTSDLERANVRLAEVEARNEQLRMEVAQSATHSAGSRPPLVEDDPVYLRLRSENSSLMRKVESARYDRDSEKSELENTSRSLQRELAGLKEDNDSLKTKLQKWSDYEDVRRELEVLKSIEFTTGYTDDVDTTDTSAKAADQNLEQLLMSRNKKLNDELTVLRVSHQDLSNQLQQLHSEHSSANAELEKSKNLTATLENDLSRLQEEVQSLPAPMSIVGSLYNPRSSSSQFPRRAGRTSPTSSIISGFDTASIASPRDSGTEPGSANPGILPMVTAQRDRFKKRNAELESDLNKSYGTVSSLRDEVASLQKDNINLYEKTRYAATYARGAAPASPAVSSPLNPNPSTVSIGGGDNGPFDRYRTQYESQISPFAQFRGRESQWAHRRMSLPERGLLQVTKVIFTNRLSRNLFALYLLSLHVVIAAMFYHT